MLGTPRTHGRRRLGRLFPANRERRGGRTTEPQRLPALHPAERHESVLAPGVVRIRCPDKGQVGLDGPLAPLTAYAYYVATFDGAKVSFYIDGTLASSKPVDGSIATRMTEFVIGRESSTGRYHFAGAIDEVAVYDKALSTVQVIAHRDLALRR
jgi:hypothetical protein